MTLACLRQPYSNFGVINNNYIIILFHYNSILDGKG